MITSVCIILEPPSGIAILLRTEIERKGCTGAVMALVSLTTSLLGAANRTLAPIFYHLGADNCIGGPGPSTPRNSNTVGIPLYA